MIMLRLRGLHVLTAQLCISCLTILTLVGSTRTTTGEWGQWGQWSTCSAECRTGITVRSRRCQHPHMLPVASLLSRGDDSVKCAGAEKEIKLCNKQACGDGRAGGWREEECAKHDASVHGGQRYAWEPFIHPSDPCKLTCRAKGQHFYSNLADRVVDGTHCAGPVTDPSAVCLQGQCVEVGCDDLVGSPSRADVCGVCKGDNSTCRTMSGIFTRQDLKRGLNPIVSIPAGSTRIRVKGLSYSSNWLALQGPDGDYFLNGGQKRSSSTDVEAAGTVFSYKTKRRCAGQCLLAKGPTDQPVKLMLNTRGRNRGVMYSFNVPVNVSDRYFRRILDSARPPEELGRNVNPPQNLPHRVHGGNRHNNKPYPYPRPANSLVDSVRSSTTTSTTTTAATTTTTTTTTTTPIPTTTITINSNNDGNFGSNGFNHVSGSSSSSISYNSKPGGHPTDRALYTDESKDDLNDEDFKDDKDVQEEDLSNEAVVEDLAPEGETPRSNPGRASGIGSHQPNLPENRAYNEKPMNITRKAMPRFIYAQTRTQESFANEARASGAQSSVQEARRFSAVGDPHAMYDPRIRHAIGPEYENDEFRNRVNSESVSSVNEHNEAENSIAEPRPADPLSDPNSGFSVGRSDHVSHLQNDSPKQYTSSSPSSSSSSHTPRAHNARSNRYRSWRRFRRPKYSQSFTFRGRHRHGQDRQDPDVSGEDQTPGQPHHRPSHVTGGQRIIRYRQQPQSQPSSRGGAALVSAYGQSPSGSAFPYSASSGANVGRRQYASQRQALRAGQSVSQNQEGSLEITNENSPQHHRGNVNFIEGSRLRQQLSRANLVNKEQHNARQQSRSSAHLDYQRELLRRRQLIEQRIAAQNAEYQRRLEERNERLRKQHLEHQQRLRLHNASQVHRHGLRHHQARGNQDRNSLSPDRSPAVPPEDGSSGGPQVSPVDRRIITRKRQRAESASPVRPEHSPPTQPLNPNNLDGNVEAVDRGRGRPLIISNRRPVAHQSRNPSPSVSPPRERAESWAGAGQAFPQRPLTPSPASYGSDNNQKEGDQRRPLIISNQRHPGETSFPPPVPGSVEDSSGSPLSRAPSAGRSELVDRRQSLLISNQRQESAALSGDSATRPAPGAESKENLLLSGGPENRQGPSPVLGPSQTPGQGVSNNQASSSHHAVNPAAAPDVASLGGGGFVAPQYIPENTRTYQGHHDLPSSFPNQLPSGGAERPLVVGGSGEVVANNAVENRLVAGGGGGVGGGLLAIDEGGDEGAYEWRVSGLSDCTLTCGGGVQQTVVVCLDTRTRAFVTDDSCLHVTRPKTKALTCNTRPCPAKWQPGAWSPCSASCGPGEQRRLVHCLARVSPTLNVTMADDNCQTAEKPESRRACQTAACNRWKVGNWSQCSVHCEEGVRTRDVYCTDHTGYDVSDDLCASSGSKPDRQEVCVMGPCGKGWYYTHWPEQCPVRCGSGTRQRHVTCLGDGGAPLPESSCNVTSRPPVEQRCAAGIPCGGQWFVGEWTQCNVTCGGGHQEREVICMKGHSGGLLSMVDEENCVAEEKPPKQRPCQLIHCQSQWYMTSWAECSRTCGTGHRTREVKCLDPGQRPSSLCPVAEKPVSREACNTGSCVTTPLPLLPSVTAEAGGCQDTFSRCLLVKHARMCRYDFYKEKCCATCTGDT